MRPLRITLAVVAILVAAGIFWIWEIPAPSTAVSEPLHLRYGITPFQDSVLPIVASDQKWYSRDGMDVALVNLGWSDVPLALASKSIDVAIYNVDSYMAASEQLANGGVDVVFYAPLYVWNGAAIMIHGDRGLKPSGDLSKLPQQDREAAVKAAMAQLRGKRIGVTLGTTFEQTVRDALKVAAMDPDKDVQLLNARPEDNLAAFLSGDLDAFSAGLTERVQAKRHGAIELVIGPDVSLPALDGIIVRKDFAAQHPAQMQKLVNLWFETINYMHEDLLTRSAIVRDYLKNQASVDYSAEEYTIAWTFQHFPDSRLAAQRDFLTPGSVYYWKPIWNSNSEALIAQRKLTRPVAENMFWGEQALTAATP